MRYISPQQQEIVESSSKRKLINGCAGSHKTDTLIKCAVTDLKKNKNPILFLTLVGSVTIEIKERLEKTLGIKIEKDGPSNHYIGIYEGTPICISNYDAWVHLMLEEREDIREISSFFSEKISILEKKTRDESTICYMKNSIKTKECYILDDEDDVISRTNNTKTPAQSIYLDESQDLQYDKMNILVNIGLSQPHLNIVIAGDFIQTIFTENGKDISNINVHSMNLFKNLQPSYFDLNICKRCPKGHVDFNNLIMEDIQKEYSIPRMESDNDNVFDKPLLFTHLKTSDTNANARINAEKVTRMIKTLIEKDATIIPNDIAIIMSKTNGNEVFYQLESTLAVLYKSMGIKENSVYHMTTRADGYHDAINWEKAKGKTKLLSIHGDKGKGHKVVFFLGLTEGAIPRDIYISTPSEIVPKSLLNVGITRSTKYLFIGFVGNYPSRYLQYKCDKLHDYAYIGWDSSDLVPEPYKSVMDCQISEKPVWNCTYKNERLKIGCKSNLEVKADISKGFEQAKNLIMYPWRKEEKLVKFGNKQSISMSFEEEHFMLLGIMAEILIQRKLRRESLFKILIKNSNSDNVIYTEDESFLSMMYDINHYKWNLEDYLQKYSGYLSKKAGLEKNIRDAMATNKHVLHNVFKCKSFQADLDDFLSPKSNDRLLTNSIWNVSLFYNQITQKIYRPAVNAFLGYFNEDISILHKNIDCYVDKFLEVKNHNSLLFEGSLNVGVTFSNKELQILNVEKHRVSINGRFDIFNQYNNSLIEVKTSKLEECSEEWIIQAITYALLLDVYKVKTSTISVVNILKGCFWEWSIPDIPTLEEIVTNKIGKKYNWHKIETSALTKRIIQMRDSTDYDINTIPYIN